MKKRSVSYMYIPTKHKVVRLSSELFNNKYIANRRDHLMGCDNYSCEAGINHFADDKLVIEETEDLDYIIKPSSLVTKGNMCVTDLYSKGLRKKIVVELRKREKLIIGNKEMSNIIYNKLEKRKDYTKPGLLAHIKPSDLNKGNIHSGELMQNSRLRLKLYLNKIVGTKCYKNSLVAHKIKSENKTQKVHKYLRDLKLITIATRKSIILSNTLKKLNPDKELSIKKGNHTNSPTMFNLILRKGSNLMYHPRVIDHLDQFLDNCGNYLNRSKQEKLAHLTPLNFEDYYSSSNYIENKMKNFRTVITPQP